MADTTVQGRVERWIVENELPRSFGGTAFSKRRVQLTWGGEFEFDAVSADGAVVVSVSTSCCKTSTGRNAIGKYHKLKADALYLLHALNATRRAMVFTDAGMLAHFQKERSRGRFPPEGAIELISANLPDDLACELQEATRSASLELSPRPASDLTRVPSSLIDRD
jgi:hypothetical protein